MIVDDHVPLRKINHQERIIQQTVKEVIEVPVPMASCELAARDGLYEAFAGSPASKRQLQFDLWGATPKSGRWDWADLKEKIAQHGLRNSLLVAPMPPAQPKF